jgi:hypothetical protein
MTVEIKVEIDTKAIDYYLSRANVKQVSYAVARALDRTMVTVQKEAAQKIQQQLKLPIRDIKQALKVKKSFGPGKPLGSQVAFLLSSTAALSLSKFKPKQLSDGVKVNITGTPQVIKHAFISRGLVFRRLRVEKPGTAIRRVGANRSELPIRKQATQAISKLIPDIAPSLAKTAVEVFYPRFNHEFSRRLK